MFDSRKRQHTVCPVWHRGQLLLGQKPDDTLKACRLCGVRSDPEGYKELPLGRV
jgi:hypothetical protein